MGNPPPPWTRTRLDHRASSAAPGRIRHVEVDTAHYKGNFPESCSLEGCYVRTAIAPAVTNKTRSWKEFLPRTKLEAIRVTTFANSFRISVPSRMSAQYLSRRRREPLAAVRRARTQSARQEISSLNDLLGPRGAKSVARLLRLLRLGSIRCMRHAFAGFEQLLESADRVWMGLEEKDRMEALPASSSHRKQESGRETVPQSPALVVRRTVARAIRIRRNARGACGGESGVSCKIRDCVPDLRNRQERR